MINVLFVSADPPDTPRMDLGAEFLAIRDSASKHGDAFHVDVAPAARVDHVLEHLLRRPTVVHFAGHGRRGTGPLGGHSEPETEASTRGVEPESGVEPAGLDPEGMLLFRDVEGRAVAVPTAALTRLFETLAGTRCVVLNAGFSAQQAQDLAQHVDCVIGTTGPIADKAAIKFSEGFYRAAFEGESIAMAFEVGKRSVELNDLGDAKRFRLFPREGVDPAAIRLSEMDANPAAMLWKQLRATSAEHGKAAVQAPSPGLTPHDWREVQPALVAPLTDRSRARVALVGRGGVGKTFLLRALLSRHDADTEPLYLTGDDVRDLSSKELGDALDLARRDAQRRRKELLLLLDALEDAADSPATLRGHLSMLQRITMTAGLRAVLAARGATWAQLATEGATSARWERVELADWPEELVRTQVNASQRPQISDHLIQILRTPLLLDLFLRTFGTRRRCPRASSRGTAS